jgi:hypothetical protein
VKQFFAAKIAKMEKPARPVDNESQHDYCKSDENQFPRPSAHGPASVLTGLPIVKFCQ